MGPDFGTHVEGVKGECIRPGTPLSLEDARRLVKGYVDHYIRLADQPEI
jgi:hypothetical protein